jgi:predicted DsbA family dithiol-disulfide isomerase
MRIEPGTIVVYSDLSCPWAHLAVHRLHETRRELGLEGAVRLVHRPLPLEVLDERPTDRLLLDAEIPVIGALDPAAGWQLWAGPVAAFPVSTLMALEAVQAAAGQSPEAAEQLDRGLRRALFAESRCITLVHEVLAVAAACPAVDVDALAKALWAGTARSNVGAWLGQARSGRVAGSPHLFLPDGSDVHNPGIAHRWVGEPGRGGFPVVDAYDPSVYAELLRRAAG